MIEKPTIPVGSQQVSIERAEGNKPMQWTGVRPSFVNCSWTNMYQPYLSLDSLSFSYNFISSIIVESYSVFRPARIRYNHLLFYIACSGMLLCVSIYLLYILLTIMSG